VPLLWVHAFRIVGGTILVPGAADPAVPDLFRTLVGLGDLLTAALALVALVALRLRRSWAIARTWLCLGSASSIRSTRSSSRSALASLTTPSE